MILNLQERIEKQRSEHYCYAAPFCPVCGCLSIIDELQKRNAELEEMRDLLWRAMIDTYALLPPERVKLASAFNYMIEEYRETYDRIMGDSE